MEKKIQDKNPEFWKIEKMGCAEREAPWDAGANELLTDDAAAVSSDDGPPPVGFPASGLL